LPIPGLSGSSSHSSILA